MKIAADRDACIGSGMCVVTASEAFDQDDGGIVVLLADGAGPANADAVRQAVDLCPAGALRVLDD